MTRYLRRLYSGLPFIREVKRVQGSLADISKQLRQLNTVAMVQSLSAIRASDARFDDKLRLHAYGKQYWSQHYEDGMIAEIFRRISTTDRTFVEIGVGNGSENNTTALLSDGWRGWWIEGNHTDCQFICDRLKEMPSIASRLKLIESMVAPDAISSLFAGNGIPEEVDLFSLDIDQDTYHVWAALTGFRPRAVVIEYNAGIPPHQSWICPYRPGTTWNGTQAFGASLKAFENLGRRFQYSLVGCDISGTNAFFVRDDLVGDKFAAPFTAENHYEPPRYHPLFRWGHPSYFFGESAPIRGG